MSTSPVSNRIDTLFAQSQRPILSVYYTAGFPHLQDTVSILDALQHSGVDMVEIGIPFSDPIADGTVIQESSNCALRNGMTLYTLFEQLVGIRTYPTQPITVPIVLMGYINPILQYGVEKFCAACAEVGIDGVIIPDLPVDVFIEEWKPLLHQHNIHYIALIAPQTPDSRISLLDSISSGFLYAVSSAGTTGNTVLLDSARIAYFQRLQRLRREGNIRNPLLIGFGIHDNRSFEVASHYADGAIIGSAFIKAIAHESSSTLPSRIHAFVHSIR
ncbi:MAG: tryptophan synthase subunit alpha [Bacteroidota bacterium]|nr:tryptophan synthase subunit alpha [Candidatus Kapabacteria bacterium]MDW8219149.1 tryptophan synthase subunit alpha [Bacteroidota bacterium]